MDGTLMLRGMQQSSCSSGECSSVMPASNRTRFRTGGALPKQRMLPLPVIWTTFESTLSSMGASSTVAAHASLTAGASPCAQRHCRIGMSRGRLNRYCKFAIDALRHRIVARARSELDEVDRFGPGLGDHDAGAALGDHGDLFAVAAEQIVVEIAIAGDLKGQVGGRELLRHSDADDFASRAVNAIRKRFAG